MRPRVFDPVPSLLAWLCPPRCAACDEPLGPEALLFCVPCEASLEPLGGPRGEGGGPREPRAGGHWRNRPTGLGQVTSLYAYGGALARCLRRYKYAGRLDLARPLAALLAPALEGVAAQWVPIPSSRGALRRRGFDPVMEVLRAVPGVRGRWTPLLERVDHREAQAGLAARERRTLGPDAFRIRRGQVAPDRPVCLVDDVLTTGATLRAGARALRAAGVRAVQVVTLARSEAEPPRRQGATRENIGSSLTPS